MIGKDSLYHENMLVVWQMFARFGFNFCFACGENIPNRLLTKEHLQAKSSIVGINPDVNNLYPACYDCNTKKAKISAEKFFCSAELQENLRIIESKIAVTVTMIEVNEAIIKYVELFLKDARKGISPTSAQIRLLSDKSLRELMGQIDLTDCLIRTNEKDIESLKRYHLTEKAKIFASNE
jgi:hypothetical protein